MNTTEYEQIYNYLQNPNQRHVPRSIPQQSVNYTILEDRLFRKNNGKYLLVIQSPEVDQIVSYAHDHPMGGHFGFEKTLQKILQHYWWPKMGRYIEQYVKSCETCQKMKNPTKVEPLQSITPIGTMKKWGIDLIGPLPRTIKGNQYLVVSIDYLTKWPEAKAIGDKRAETVASFVVDEIICRHGVPSELVTDQGAEFNNQLLKHIAKKTSMTHILTSPYHPQANGQVERMNQTLAGTIRKLIEDYGNTWEEYVATALFAYRTTRQSTTKYTPFYLLHGYEAVTPLNKRLARIGNPKDLQKRLGQLIEILSNRVQARENIRERQKIQKKYYDRGLIGQSYIVGDLVWIDKKVLRRIPRDKMDPKLEGPFIIMRKNKNGTYYVKDRKTGVELKTAYSGDKFRKYIIQRRWGEPMVEIEQLEGIHEGTEFPRQIDASDEDV
ncbi:5231_t:CDS:1 [Paraglomus occultum]|uniref:5231_t:CDS:1 n=1 Tax=Paraglomus occultum TaxID=144539 RepID=A0A9N9C8W0_9GLOM|nr:5231_t:CDS:1 [Paraglomus occultum]